jgi:hypothetical protein
MKHNSLRLIAPSAALLGTALLATVSLLGCDRRTPEEKGRDYAKEKLGFVEGAADELAKSGKVIGADLGKGVGELLKGTGSSVKDVTHPPVEVRFDEELKALGLSVEQANEGEDSADGRNVVVHLKANKDYSGKLVLRAQGDRDAEVQALEPLAADLSTSTTQALRFAFDPSVRLSKMKFFELGPGLTHTIVLAQGAEQSAIQLNQLSEE